MDYGGILSRTWEITWKYKGLWILGLLASCGAAGQGNGGNGGQGIQYSLGGTQGFWPYLESEPWILIAVVALLILVALALALLVLVLTIIGQGGLIAGFIRADEGEDVSLGEAFRLGIAQFWKLLGIRIVFWLLGVALVILVIAGSFVFIIGTAGLGALLIPLCCCLILPLILVGIMVEAYIILTMVAAVEEDLGVLDAFQRSWEVFQPNIVQIGIMALILVFGSGIVGFLIAVPMIFLVIPVLIGGMMGGDQSIVAGLIAAAFCFLAYLPVILLVSSIITTFVTGGWTITYRRLTGVEGSPELAVTPSG